MRHAVPLILILVLPLAFLPLALAGALDGCVPSCDVPSTTAGYVTPVTVVTDGETVSWTALDTPHTATSYDWCFNSAYGPGAGKVKFTLENGTVYAKEPGVKNAKPCPNAEPLGDGSFRISYYCIYHQSMVGELVIVPN